MGGVEAHLVNSGIVLFVWEFNIEIDVEIIRRLNIRIYLFIFIIIIAEIGRDHSLQNITYTCTFTCKLMNCFGEKKII